MSCFGRYVLSQLSIHGWKQKDLAQKTGINETTLSKYISGQRTPTEQVIESIARVLRVSPEVLKVAQGRIPERLQNTLCDHADETLSVLIKLAATSSRNGEYIEQMARNVLFRYLTKIGREKFVYPIDVKNLLKTVYGLEVYEASFRGLDLAKTGGELCGLFIPEYVKIGQRSFSNVVMLNSDVLKKYNTGREIGRFTMAHEAFHKEMWDSREILSPSKKNVVYCRIKNIPATELYDMRTERQANRFAGALLMPAKDFRFQIEKYPVPLNLAAAGEELRSRYGVTISALQVRLRELGISFTSN